MRNVFCFLLLFCTFSMGAVAQQSFYEFSGVTTDGRIISFSDYREKVVLIVRSAPVSRNAWQYSFLEEWHGYYNPELQILDMETLETNESIPESSNNYKQYLSSGYTVSFPRFTIPSSTENRLSEYLFSKLREYAEKEGTDSVIVPFENFSKILLNRSGEVVRCYSASHDLLEIQKDIKVLLGNGQLSPF